MKSRKQVLREGDEILEEVSHNINQHYIRVKRIVNGEPQVLNLSYRKGKRR